MDRQTFLICFVKNLENSLDIWKYEKLDETNRIANLIKQKL